MDVASRRQSPKCCGRLGLPAWPKSVRGDLDHHRVDHPRKQALNVGPAIEYALSTRRGVLLLASALVEKAWRGYGIEAR